MTGLTITTFHHIGSLVLGIGAWVLACLAIRGKKTFVSYRFSVGRYLSKKEILTRLYKSYT